MKPTQRFSILALLVFALSACILPQVNPSATPSQAATQTATQTAIPTATRTALPTATQTATPSPIQLTVLYTNDEHGWMEGMQAGQGAANLYSLWKEKEGYRPNGAYLVLSGGDNWTGPAISTWFQGQSMVEVMNAMGYRASAIGNHEFDFGLQALKDRLKQANFPYLSSNIRAKADNSTPTDLGIQPFSVVDIAGLKVGLVALTTKGTPRLTNPKNVADFNFIDYEQALREVVPQARAAGAQVILAPSHICLEELEPLARQVADLKISLFGAGHCNELVAEQIGETVVLAGGYHYTSYAYAHLTFDPSGETLLSADYGTRTNEGGQPDETITAIIRHWYAKVSSELNVVIGYLKADIPKGSQEMGRLITGAWLAGYPGADVAISNWGGMRDRLPAGKITLSDVVSVMPFDDVLIELHLTGAQLTRVLNKDFVPPPVSGVRRQKLNWALERTGQPLDPKATYTLLVNDFMYAGGDGYDLLSDYDPQGYNTAIDWRQPVIDWIRSQNSSPNHPLEEAIAMLGK